MSNRIVFTILGLVIIILAFTGIGLLQLHKEKSDALKELELIKQQEEAKARMAAEESEAERQRTLTEEAGREKEIERQRTLDKQQELMAQQEEQRIARERQRQAEQELQRLAEERKKRQSALNISFSLNEFNSGPRRIALVHDGDEVEISVDRKSGASQKVYVGLIPPDSEQSSNSENFQFQQESFQPIFQLAQYRRSPPPPRYRPYNRYPPPRPPQRAPIVRPPPPRTRPLPTPALVNIPINDRDRFRIGSNLCPRSTFKSQVNSQRGGILCVGIGGTGNSSGSYLVDVRIFGNNRWNIKPSRIP